MAQKVQHALLKEIYSCAGKIQQRPTSPRISQRIKELGDHVSHYLAQNENSDPRRQFFNLELQDANEKIQQGPSDIAKSAKKVKRAALYLDQIVRGGWKKIWPSAEQGLKEFEEAYRARDWKSIHSFSKRLKELGKNQIDTLFGWALVEWDPIVLHRIIKHCNLSSTQLEVLVEVALEQGKFHQKFGYPLMLYHFNGLSPEKREMIQRGLEEKSGEVFQQMGSAFVSIKEALEEVLSLGRRDFVAIPKRYSREDLQHFPSLISDLFGKLSSEKMAKDPRLAVAIALWVPFLEKWVQEAPSLDLRKSLEEIVTVLSQHLMPNLPEGYYEHEEKGNSSLVEEIRWAMRHTDFIKARNLLRREKEIAQLPEGEIKSLLTELFDYPACFPLLYPYSEYMKPDLFAELLEWGIKNRKWAGVDFLMALPIFFRLELSILLKFNDQLPGDAPIITRRVVWKAVSRTVNSEELKPTSV